MNKPILELDDCKHKVWELSNGQLVIGTVENGIPSVSSLGLLGELLVEEIISHRKTIEILNKSAQTSNLEARRILKALLRLHDAKVDTGDAWDKTFEEVRKMINEPAKVWKVRIIVEEILEKVQAILKKVQDEQESLGDEQVFTKNLYKKLRLQLFYQLDHCRWCGKKLVLGGNNHSEEYSRAVLCRVTQTRLMDPNNATLLCEPCSEVKNRGIGSF